MRERECPQCRWTAVTDASGRRRLEMRWQAPESGANVPDVRAA